ncbi:hypothetical protein [Paenibacillus xylanexedens]|uniref:hypothetical protein n=1 Tax=Paenibacillus xylanexedens TaxID=528191 RepID=UPI0011A48F0C|nr:hypothetical protein [Paenibacillus xylanexedens]
MKRITPDKLRDIAISILQHYPRGVKQSDFWKIVHEHLSDKYDLTAYTVKNALWDIEEQRKGEVIKIRHSPKQVVLYPVGSDEEDDEFESNLTQEERANMALSELAVTLSSISMTAEAHGLTKELDSLHKIYKNELSVDELEALISLKLGIELIEKSLKTLSKVKQGGE